MGKEKTQFKKGQSGNPSGRPKEDIAIKKFKETTYKEFIAALQKYGWMTKQQALEVLQNPKSKLFDIMFCQIVSSAARGDKDARAVLLDRLWGKVKEEVKNQIEVIDPEKEKIKKMSDGELMQYIKDHVK